MASDDSPPDGESDTFEGSGGGGSSVSIVFASAERRGDQSQSDQDHEDRQRPPEQVPEAVGEVEGFCRYQEQEARARSARRRRSGTMGSS